MNISSISNGAGQKPVITAQPVLRSEAAKAAFGAGVRETDATTPASSDPANPRLDAFAQRIESRFKAVLESESLSPRQREALEGQYEKFQSMLNRFEAAYLDGRRTPGEGAQQGMQRLLDRFSNSVNHILAGGDAPKDPSGGSTPGSVARPIGIDGNHGRIDKVG